MYILVRYTLTHAYIYRHVLENDDHLVEEMTNAGIMCTPNSSIFKTIHNELVEFAKKHPLFNYKVKDTMTTKGGMDDTDESDDSSSSSSSSNSDVPEDEFNLDYLLRNSHVFNDEGRVSRPSVQSVPPGMTSEEWATLVKKYAKRPTNTLEMDRESYYSDRHQGSTLHVDDCQSEADLMMVQRQR